MNHQKQLIVANQAKYTNKQAGLSF